MKPMPSTTKRQLMAIMFTDIAGYTNMMQEDEQKSVNSVIRHREVLEKHTDNCEGRVVQYYGDGSLSVFDSAVKALKCAKAMQRAYLEGPMLPVRIGIHLGDILFREGNIFGDGVNVASRIESIGVPGSILISEQVQNEIKNHPEFKTASLGKFSFKNVKRDLEVYALSEKPFVIPERDKIQGKLKESVKSRETRGSGNFTKFGAFSLVLILLLAGLWIWPSFKTLFSPSIGAEELSAAVQQGRIAVMIFENRTGDPSLDDLGKIITDWVTQGLMETGQAKIVSARSVYDNLEYQKAFLQPVVGKESFAERTGAVNMLEGSYLKQGDSLLIHAKISSLQNDELLFSLRPIVCTVQQPLDGVNELRQRMMGFWITRDSPKIPAAPPIYDAYREYLYARGFWQADDNKVLQHLDRAIGLDSTFIEPKIAKATLYYNYGQYEKAQALARHLEAQMVKLNGQQRNNVNYLQAVLQGNNRSAYQHARQEYELDPKDVFANTSMAVLALEFVNDPQQSLSILQEVDADSLDYQECPYCLSRLELMARAHMDLGDNVKALEALKILKQPAPSRSYWEKLIRVLVRLDKDAALEQLLEESRQAGLHSDFRYLYYAAAKEYLLTVDLEKARYFGKMALELYQDKSYRSSRKMLARTQFLLENYAEAEQLFQAIWASNRQDRYSLVQLGAIWAARGEKAMAEKVVAQLSSLDRPFDFGYIPYHQARIKALLGERAAAIRLLKKSLQEGRRYSFTEFAYDPDLMTLYDEPSFKALLQMWQ